MKRSLILFLVVFSCKKEIKYNNVSLDCVLEKESMIELKGIEKKNNAFSEFKNDTIFSKGNEIIFFMPNEKFFKKNLQSFEGSEETDADFKHYVNEVYNDIQNNLDFPIKAKITESRFLGIINFKKDTIYIDRYKNSLDYGTLLNFKNKNYILEEGVFTDDDFFTNFGPIEEESNINSEKTSEFDLKLKVVLSDENNRNYDTVIKVEDLISYLDIEFKYEKFEKNIVKDKVIFIQDSTIVTVLKESFDKSKYTISSTRDLGITLNGQSLEGVDEFLPSEIISSISVKLNNQDISIEKRDYENISMPNFEYSNVYQIDENNLLLEMHNSDGAGGYTFYLILNNKGKSEKYILYP